MVEGFHPCRGVEVGILILEGKNPYLEWPWKEQAELAMAWDIQIKGGVLTIHAPTCLQSMPNGNKLCWECWSLESNQRLCHIQDWIHRGVPKTTPYKYLGMSRLIKMLRWKENQINTLKLHFLNTNQKLDLLTTSNLDYKQFAVAVGECNVPCVNQLVQSALQKRHGINEIIQLVGRVMVGTYHPRYTEQDHLMSIVLYHLGGAWVAEFAHTVLGMPGLSTTQWHCTTSIQASPSFPTQMSLPWTLIPHFKLMLHPVIEISAWSAWSMR